MATTIPATAGKFDTEIHVGNMSIRPGQNKVWATTPLGVLSFTPEQACAFAAALQAVAVHTLEENEGVAA